MGLGFCAHQCKKGGLLRLADADADVREAAWAR